MRSITVSIFALLLMVCGCRPGSRDDDADFSHKDARQKEQQLAAWEQRLEKKEKELNDFQALLDSAKKEIDSSSTYDPAIMGTWTVRMSCTETSCEGSAIGDIKTEQWEISYNESTVVVKAYSGSVLSRVYTGKYKNQTLYVLEEKPGANVTISAVLHFANEKRIEGTREIVQPACKIVYSLTAERSK